VPNKIKSILRDFILLLLLLLLLFPVWWHICHKPISRDTTGKAENTQTTNNKQKKDNEQSHLKIEH
jgi:hypothetical protein